MRSKVKYYKNVTNEFIYKLENGNLYYYGPELKEWRISGVPINHINDCDKMYGKIFRPITKKEVFLELL